MVTIVNVLWNDPGAVVAPVVARRHNVVASDDAVEADEAKDWKVVESDVALKVPAPELQEDVV